MEIASSNLFYLGWSRPLRFGVRNHVKHIDVTQMSCCVRVRHVSSQIMSWEELQRALCTVDAHHIGNFLCGYLVACWCSSRMLTERCGHVAVSKMVYITSILANAWLTCVITASCNVPLMCMRIARLRYTSRRWTEYKWFSLNHLCVTYCMWINSTS